MANKHDDSFFMPLVYKILRSEPTLKVQLIELVVLTVLMELAMKLGTRFARFMSQGKPYLPQVIMVEKKTLKNFLGFDVEDDVALAHWEEYWAVSFQHIFGGLLCLPAITGGFPITNETAWILARHGALCEVAWELGDLIKKLYDRLCGGEEGKRRVPITWLVVMMMHHSAGFCFAIPMNIYFYDCRAYFELIVMLQGAAGTALLATQYGATLDLTKPSELSQMFWVTLLTCANGCFARAIWYWYSAYKLQVVFWESESWGFFTCNVLIGFIIFPMFNLLIVTDMCKKTRKFGSMYFSKSQKLDAHED